MIAGPNGSGKTTFAREFLPLYAHCPNFINSDLIAQGLAPFSPEKAAIKAGKLVLRQIKEYAANQIDFGFETTLSGKSYAKTFDRLKVSQYKIYLFFLWLPDVDLSLARIKQRVQGGGHHVPEKDVRRRFDRSIQNFKKIYKDRADSWMFFDNSTQKPSLIAGSSDGKLLVEDKAKYEGIFELE